MLALDYTLDLTSVARGGLDQGTRHLDSLSISLDLDLERLVNWPGANAHIEALNTSGGAPNDLAASLQGINSIEVGARRPTLYQAWIEQSLANDRLAALLGLYDVTGEFNAADSAGLLVGAPFGTGPEFAGAGPSGVAAYPSTALGARLVWRPTDAVYVQVAVANATVGSPGEDGGLDTDFDQGVLTVAEAGWTGRGKIALGVWRFSDKMDDQRETDALGAPLRRTPQGAYAIIDQPVGERASAFLKVGVSDGDTQPVKSSWQAGLQMQPVFAARPDSALAIGVSQARLSSSFRANAADVGVDLAPAETLVELTYSDLISEHVRLQPSLQYVRRPAADRSIDDAVVVGLRLNVAY